MSDRLRNPVWWLKAVCALLAVLIVAQAASALLGSDSPGGVAAADVAITESNDATTEDGEIAVPATFDPITAEFLFGKKPPRPRLPVMLVGIADGTAFIRSPRGRTGALEVGKAIDGVKLIRIGVNRVVVEEDGKQKEIMMHEGVGGESLLPTPPKPASPKPAPKTPRPTGPERAPAPAKKLPAPAKKLGGSR